MASELPPQFIDSDGSEICPTCASVTGDICALKEMVEGLQRNSVNHRLSLSPEVIIPELMIDSASDVLDRRQRVADLNDSVEALLGNSCLRFARARPDGDL